MERIAVVEDMPDILEIVCLILNDVYRIDCFPGGRSFIESFVPGHYALVILDLIMPGMDGYEIYRQIRQHDVTVPVAAFTVSVVEAQKTKALRMGLFAPSCRNQSWTWNNSRENRGLR